MMVPDAGFEPATFGLQNRCTTTVLIRRGPSHSINTNSFHPLIPINTPVYMRPPTYPAHSANGAIAQLVERLHGMQEVSGSIPLSSTRFFRKKEGSPHARPGAPLAR